MEAKTSFITAFTTFWVIVLTVTIAAILATTDVSREMTLTVGISALACLVFFTWILVKLGATERKKRVTYEVN